MGTRSHTYVMEGERAICLIYRQYDGYPSDHGQELYDFLVGKVGTNGFSRQDGSELNGAGDLAVRLVTALKGNANKTGGLYLSAVDGADDDGVDYVYKVGVIEGQEPHVEVRGWNGRELIASGPVSQAIPAAIVKDAADNEG